MTSRNPAAVFTAVCLLAGAPSAFSESSEAAEAAEKPAEAAETAKKASSKPSKAVTAPVAVNTRKPIPAPDDVAAPPEDAEKTASGLASKVLQEGTGELKPAAADTVKVHYTGWTTDGEMFDSSVQRGEPTEFPLNRVIKGWTEGLQLMVEGEKRRFWIPEDLAYGPKVEGSPRPGGMLVFDVELLGIQSAPKAPEGIEKAPEDAAKTASGIAHVELSAGKGDKSPGPDDVATIHFTGWTTTGDLVQDTRQQGGPVAVPLNNSRLPEGWSECIQTMVEGEKSRFWVPAGPGTGIPGGTVVCDFELVSFEEGIKPPPVPEDVGAMPDDAEKSESGLAWKVLDKGEGGEDAKPKASDTVKVHYTGWTTDGKMFDSSVTRGEPATFPLNGVIKGWTEGVQLMSKGEKRRFWIPEDLAYGPKVEGSPRPGGMLVFDIELLDIVR